MKVFVFVISFLLHFSLAAQSSLISFNELEIIKKEDGTPIYYLEGRPFSGKTYDYYKAENVVLEHYLDHGLLRLKEGSRDGQTIERARFKNGVLDGVYRKFFGNGQKYVEHHYRNGKMHGPQYGWKKDGTVRFVAEYRNGLEMTRLNYPPPGGFESLIKH